MEKCITLYPPTRLNGGLSEDSEDYVVTEPTKVVPLGPPENGALRVRIVLDNGRLLSEEVFYWHQPEKRGK